MRHIGYRKSDIGLPRIGPWFVGMGIFAALFITTSAFAIERFPPPDFTEHTLPETTTPPAQATWHEYLDVAVLVVFLAVASWLALKRRSRRGLVVLSIAAVIYFGFYRVGCVCAIGSIQNVALALADATYAIPLFVLAFFLLPIAFTLFFGRTFCAAVCPHGALQDLVHIKTLHLPRWLNASLGLIPFLYLGLAVFFAAAGASFIICRYDPFIGFFRFDGTAWLLIFGGVLLLIGTVVARPYCRFLCPLGAIFRLVSPFAKRHVKIYPDKCINCRLCEDSCPVDAIEPSDPPRPMEPPPARGPVLAMLGLTVLLIVAGAWAFAEASPTLARVHPTIKLAERIEQAESGEVALAESSLESDTVKAFRAQGRQSSQLYKEARTVRARFRSGAWWFGGFVGLVIGGKLVQSVGRRRRDVYEVDRAACVACGRCFEYCPRDPSCKVQIEGFLAAEQLTDVTINQKH